MSDSIARALVNECDILFLTHNHPDHVDPKRFEVQDIVREILRGLPRETDHDTGADLVPDFFQCPEAGVTHRPEVVAVRGVQC